MGAVLRKDEGLGVVARGGGAETRVALGGDETCRLLVLRILYEEKRNAVRLAEFPSATVFDFARRHRATTERDLKKTKRAAMLHRFSMARLIKAPKDEGDPDALILLYPSLALALDQEGISEVLEWMKGARAGGQSGKAQTPVLMVKTIRKRMALRSRVATSSNQGRMNRDRTQCRQTCRLALFR